MDSARDCSVAILGILVGTFFTWGLWLLTDARRKREAREKARKQAKDIEETAKRTSSEAFWLTVQGIFLILVSIVLVGLLAFVLAGGTLVGP
jgi:hypothetical protein